MTSLVAALVAHGIASLTITHIPSNSPTRVPALLAAVATSLYGVSCVDHGASWADVYTEYMLGYCIHAIYILYLRSYSAPSQLSPRSRRIWSIQRLFNPRDIPSPPELDQNGNTNTQDRGPDLDPVITKRKLRRRFIIGRLTAVAFCLIVRWVFKNIPLVMGTDDIKPLRHSMIRRLHDLDAREWVVRLYLSITIVFTPYLEFRAAHSLLSVIAVGIFSQDVSQWPDVFGKVTAAYTLRGFWADFWHRLMRKAFTANSSAVVYGVLGVPSKRVGRYLVIVSVFMISGVMHAIMSYFGSTDECKQGSIVFTLRHYCFIVAAIILEDVVIRLIQAIGIGRNGGRQWRLVGYCWVILFHIWALPKMVYPSMLCQVGPLPV